MTRPDGDRVFPLGRKVEHDPASRRYAVQAPKEMPAYSVTWPRRVPILDQGNLGSCTGNAMAAWLATDSKAHSGRSTVEVNGQRLPVDEALAVQLYSDATRLDIWDGAYPPDDTGSSGNAVAKAARNLGLITGWKHAFGLDAALGALFDGPILIGIPWRANMYRPLDSGYLDCTGEDVGGHELIARAIDPRKKHIMGDQSWGLPWGRPANPDGRWWMHWDDFEDLLAHNGDVTIPIG